MIRNKASKINNVNTMAILLLSIALSFNSFSQVSKVEGEVTYLSSKHVYVRFVQANAFEIGDTLFVKIGEKDTPVLRIKELSSNSSACERISDLEIEIKTKVFGYKELKGNSEIIEKPKTQDTLLLNDIETTEKKKLTLKPTSKLKLTASSYIGLPALQSEFSLRMKYMISYKATNINSSKISFESMLSFSHGNTNIEEIKSDIRNGLRIYSLSTSYNSSKGYHFSVGRKTNSSISNIGPVDGLKIDKTLRSLKYGLVLGSRPDYSNYWINPRFFLAGGYLAFDKKYKGRPISTTLSLFELRNKSAVDRRFVYFQHSNSLVKKLFVFASFETDLYKMDNGISSNSLNVSSLYLMMKYNPSSKFSITGNYDFRNNIIYYETYKSYIDILLDEEAKQGLGGAINMRLFKNLKLSLRSNYRFSKGDTLPSTNYNMMLGFLKTPFSNQQIYLSSIYMKSALIRGFINGFTVNQYFEPSKINYSVSYKYFFGNYTLGEISTNQHIFSLNMNKTFAKAISLSFNTEFLLESGLLNSRIYLSLSKKI